MNRLILLILLLIPLLSFSQEQDYNILSQIDEQWIFLGNEWRYQKGDNLDWAKPEFNDTNWNAFTATRDLNLKAGEPIAKPNEIVWFRQHIQLDSLINDAVVMRIYQTGASEIYLDGDLVQSLGSVNSDLNSAKSKGVYQHVLSLPLQKQKQHVLAIRFQNIQSKYPLNRDKTGSLGIRVAALNYVLDGTGLNYKVRFLNEKYEQSARNLHVALGIGIVMFILFLSLFFFFPKEQINGYFALATFFFCGFIANLIFGLYVFGYDFNYDYAIGLSTSLYVVSIIFCLYKIFDQALGYIFWSIVALCALNLVVLFYYPSKYLAGVLALIGIFESIRVSFINRKKEKIGAAIFISAGTINLLYWLLFVLNNFIVIRITNLGAYQYYAYCFIPLSIAIYLGYKFGKRSQTLRLKLEEVQSLSKEKETILSEQNITLEKQVTERTAKLHQSLEELKATQSQLIQSEKMASLGELTAGIAHEIQNPLNFVNNFSEVSTELVDEMNEELDNGDYEEAKAIATDIKQNLEKINHHGKRADGIVKGMLQHSRSGSGTKELTDINKLTDEYLRLAYHGLRAKDKTFNADLDSELDETIGEISIVAQDIGRVILNLLTNAFYAVHEKQQSKTISNFKPTVSVKTINNKDSIRIEVGDNGNGIPKPIVDRIFEPFFTTKPTGQGTGLGLSMSYDIIKAHNGDLSCNSVEGHGTRFIIEIPINS